MYSFALLRPLAAPAPGGRRAALPHAARRPRRAGQPLCLLSRYTPGRPSSIRKPPRRASRRRRRHGHGRRRRPRRPRPRANVPPPHQRGRQRSDPAAPRPAMHHPPRGAAHCGGRGATRVSLCPRCPGTCRRLGAGASSPAAPRTTEPQTPPKDLKQRPARDAPRRRARRARSRARGAVAPPQSPHSSSRQSEQVCRPIGMIQLASPECTFPPIWAEARRVAAPPHRTYPSGNQQGAESGARSRAPIAPFLLLSLACPLLCGAPTADRPGASFFRAAPPRPAGRAQRRRARPAPLATDPSLPAGAARRPICVTGQVFLWLRGDEVNTPKHSARLRSLGALQSVGKQRSSRA